MRISDWSSDVCSSDLTAPFAEDACDAAERVTYDLSSFRCFVSGGAPIPPQLVGRTSRLLGAELIPSWGMTEAGITTIGRLTDCVEKRASSAGKAVDGVAVRVVDDEGAPVPFDAPGHLQLRASGQHVALLINDERNEEHTSETQTLIRI